jgi:hypothetical protein
MDGKIEQRICIKFCMMLGKSTTETPEMLHEVFGEHSLSQDDYHLPEDDNHHSHRRGNLKSYIL